MTQESSQQPSQHCSQQWPRIGHGYDVHGFEPGTSIKLAGVDIPYTKKFKAHSDGDVLIHALCDALLGASGSGDIGHHFPDTDKAYENIDSRLLLKKVHCGLLEKSYDIANVDITIVAQAPKLAPYLEAMCANICEDIALSQQQVNIKATTTEGLGYIGREEGVAVHAVVLIYPRETKSCQS